MSSASRTERSHRVASADSPKRGKKREIRRKRREAKKFYRERKKESEGEKDREKEKRKKKEKYLVDDVLKRKKYVDR